MVFIMADQINAALNVALRSDDVDTVLLHLLAAIQRLINSAIKCCDRPSGTGLILPARGNLRQKDPRRPA